VVVAPILFLESELNLQFVDLARAVGILNRSQLMQHQNGLCRLGLDHGLEATPWIKQVDTGIRVSERPKSNTALDRYISVVRNEQPVNQLLAVVHFIGPDDGQVDLLLIIISHCNASPSGNSCVEEGVLVLVPSDIFITSFFNYSNEVSALLRGLIAAMRVLKMTIDVSAETVQQLLLLLFIERVVELVTSSLVNFFERVNGRLVRVVQPSIKRWVIAVIVVDHFPLLIVILYNDLLLNLLLIVLIDHPLLFLILNRNLILFQGRGWASWFVRHATRLEVVVDTLSLQLLLLLIGLGSLRPEVHASYSSSPSLKHVLRDCKIRLSSRETLSVEAAKGGN